MSLLIQWKVPTGLIALPVSASRTQPNGEPSSENVFGATDENNADDDHEDHHEAMLTCY